MTRATTFTSYINIQEAAGIDQSLSRLERKATSTFDRIAKQAQRVSATTTTGPGAGRQVTGLNSLAAAERQHAAAIQRTAAAQTQAAAASARLTGRHMLESNAARAAAASTTTLERSLRLASVAANVAQGPLGPLAGRLSAVATAVRELAGIRLGLVGAGAGLAAFTRYASIAQDMKSALRPLYESQQQVNQAFAEARTIADSARVGLQPVVDLYARLTLAGREAGLSQQRINKLTDIAAKAAKLSGGATQSQEAALYQFSQGVGSGNLGGDELRSVREGALRLAKAIADGLGVPMAELKKLGKEGKLTPKVIADALEKESARIDAELAKLPPTISSATSKLNNAFLAIINGTDEAYGVSRVFATGLELLANNLDLAARAAVGLVATYAAFRTVNMASRVAEDTRAWMANREEIRRNANEQVEAARQQLNEATKARAASAQRIVALRAERTAIQQQILVERQLAAEARAARNELGRKVDGRAYAGRALDILELQKATDRAREADVRLSAVQDRSRQVALELHQSTQQLAGSKRAATAATTAYAAASTTAQRAAATFGNAMRGLWAAINPVGIALAIGINLLIEYATREDAAAGAADRMASAQANLSKFIDQTTGKIIEQNRALVNNQILTAKEAQRSAIKNYQEERKGFLSSADDGVLVSEGYAAVIEQDPRIKKIRDEYANRRLSAGAASSQLDAILKATPKLAATIEPLQARLGSIAKLAQEAEQRRAEVELLSGNNTPEARRRAFGNFTGEDPDPMRRALATADGDDKVAASKKKRAKATDEAAKAERELNRIQELTDKRVDTLSRYDEQPKAIDRAARDVRELEQLVGKTLNGVAEISKANPLGKGIYTAEMAAADAARINYGVRQPIRDAIQEQERGLEISKLRLEGYDLEADALERALQLQDQIGEVTADEYRKIVENARAQREINDALASRERQVRGILDAANQTRDAFEDMLVNLRKNPVQALKNFGNTIIDNIVRIEARRLTEKLFAGADEKLRQLVEGSNGVDRAANILERNVSAAAASTTKLSAANDNLAGATEYAAQRIRAAADGLGPGVSGLAPSSTLDRVIGGGTGGKSLENTFDSVFATAGLFGASGPLIKLAKTTTVFQQATKSLPASSTAGTTSIGPDGEPVTDFTVSAARTKIIVKNQTQNSGPSGASAYEKIFGTLGEKLDKTFKSGTFFSGIGKGVGKALSGAGEGMLASSLVGALGIKQSQTGAAIGGALGSFIPGVGSIVGGLIGGTLGGLFKKTKSGAAVLGINSDGVAGVTGTSGNSKELQGEAKASGNAIADRLNQIADALGADVGNFAVSIGKRSSGWISVSASGSSQVANKSWKKKNVGGDLIYDGKDEEEAMRIALLNALQDGAIKGISEASNRILQSGQDLDRALRKATAIESIPKRLLQRTDPTRYAVQQLNTEFERLIGYLKEGGATAQQFADAQKLYDLERADAIKQASQQTVSALQAYLDEMKGGAASPLNRATVYQNAAEKLSTFRSDIAAGKAVDQQDLLTAAKNFQDASRALFGSGQQFFTDFDDLFALISRARDNTTSTVPGSTGPLPASPFDTAEVQALIQGQTNATLNQTTILGSKLDDILGALNTNGYSPGAIGLLPGFSAFAWNYQRAA